MLTKLQGHATLDKVLSGDIDLKGWLGNTLAQALVPTSMPLNSQESVAMEFPAGHASVPTLDLDDTDADNAEESDLDWDQGGNASF